MDKIIYMDNAASTRLYEEALDAMLPFYKDDYANPGGIYEYADNAKIAVAKAREAIASTLGADLNEIYFTGGGTESDNWAVKGAAKTAAGVPAIGNVSDRRGHVPHIITGATEHHAVLNSCKWLEKNGCRISYVKPDRNGIIKVSDIERLIDRDTVLISVMTVNNEIGTLQPIGDIGAMAHERGILFHTDAVAAYGHIPIDVRGMHIDMLSASGHKFNGPKGIGFLYVNGKYRPEPFLSGGSQEQGRRAGTENVPGIVGMASAARLHHNNMEAYLKRRRLLDDHFVGKLKSTDFCFGGRTGDARVIINGDPEQRLAGIINMTVPGIDAEELIVRLGMEGVCISAGAACASAQDEASHVLRAIGLDRDAANSAIRISMNEDNTEEEIDILFEMIRRIVN